MRILLSEGSSPFINNQRLALIFDGEMCPHSASNFTFRLLLLPLSLVAHSTKYGNKWSILKSKNLNRAFPYNSVNHLLEPPKG